MSRHAVITGVSSGIGLDAARELIERGWHVFGSVRKEEDGVRVQTQLGDRFTPLLFDVTDHAAIQTAAELVEERLAGAGLAGLINNAGIAVPGPLAHIDLEEIRWQLEVNLIGVVAVIQAFLPLLGAQKDWPHRPGRIVNVSSVSGQVAYPFFGPYAMSKHALEALSHSLRRELMLYGIDVSIIGPGTVKTPIWEKAGELDIEPWLKTDYGNILAKLQKGLVRQGEGGISVKVTSEAIRHALESPKPKVRYALPSSWLSGWLLPRYLPARWVDRFAAKRMGLR